MESFTVPASDAEWPKEQFLADSREIEDTDAVLEDVCSRIVKRPDLLYNLKNFSILCALIKKQEKLRSEDRSRILSALKVASSSLAGSFSKNLASWQSLPERKDLERQFIQTLKAYAFLLSRIILSEDDILKGNVDAISEEPAAAPPKRRGKKSKEEDANQLIKQGKASVWVVEKEREEILSTVVALIELPLAGIWSPDISLLNLFAHLAFSLFNNPLNAKSSSLRSSCMAILRPLIATYHYQTDCIQRFIHALRTNEFIVSGVLELTDSMRHDTCVQSFLTELFLEVSKIPAKDIAATAILAKNVSSLINDMCSAHPQLILPSLSLIVELLDQEAYPVRCGVIQGIGELIVKCFQEGRPVTEEKMEATAADEDADAQEEEKKQREKEKEEVAPPYNETLDALLDIMMQRLMDVSSYVRARTLATWGTIAGAKAIPLARFLPATEGAFKRLSDRTANVRKAAIELLHDLIENNPYGPNLSLTIWEQRLAEVKETLAQAGVKSVPPTPAKKTAKASKKSKKPKKDEEEAPIEIDEAEKTTEKVEKEITKEKKAPARRGRRRGRRGAQEEEEEPEEEETTKKVAEEEKTKMALDEEEENAEEDSEAKGAKDAEPDHDGDAEEMEVTEEGKEPEPAAPTAEEAAEQEEKILAAKRARDHCIQTIKFIRLIHLALPIVTTLLGSKSIGDVTEAIKLLAKAHTFKTEKAVDGIRTVLMLVCSKEPGIKEAATQAYIDLYLTPQVQVSARDMPVFIARNLISLTQGASLGQLTSLEELLKELASAGRLSQQILPVLWSYFEYKADHRVGALIILNLLYSTFPSALDKLVPHLFKFGLGPEIVDNPSLAKWTCIALQKLTKSSGEDQLKKDADEDKDEDEVNSDDEYDEDGKKGRKKTAASKKKKSAVASKKQDKKSEEKKPKVEMLVAPWDNQSILSICNFLTLTGNALPKKHTLGQLHAIETASWYPAAEQAVNAIYHLSDAPSIVLSEVLKKLAGQLARATASATQQDLRASQQIVGPIGLGGAVSAIVGRIMFLLGHIAIKQLVLIEEIMGQQLASKAHKKQHAAESKAKKKGSAADEEEPEAIELELGAVGAEAAGETHDEERARLMAQHRMVTKRMIGQFLPLVVSVCSSASFRKSDTVLYGIAVHTLSKCMLVSQEACKEHLDLILEILADESTAPAIRSNIIILLGDIAMRFPNVFEVQSAALYERLADTDRSVRKHALVVVSHLVLTNMVKPRGYMSDIAVCLEDSDTEIVDAARLFFKELAAKDGALMPLLPDAISSLYRKNLDFEVAKNILQFLLSFVDLQRDLTSLVDKLCQQFVNSPEVRSWRYLAYCISTLSHNEASIERLAAHFKLYKDALHDEVTNNFFLQAVKTRRTGKAAAAAAGGASGASVADALEDKISSIQAGTFVDGLEPEESTVAAGGKKRAKGAKRASAAKRKRNVDLDEDEGVWDSEDEPPKRTKKQAPAPTTSSRPRRAARNIRKDVDSEDDFVDDLE